HPHSLTVSAPDASCVYKNPVGNLRHLHYTGIPMFHVWHSTVVFRVKHGGLNMKVSILTHYDLIPEIDVLSRKLARKSNITARIGYLTPELNQLLQDNSPAAGYRQIELDFQDSKIGEKFIDTICFDYGV